MDAPDHDNRKVMRVAPICRVFLLSVICLLSATAARAGSWTAGSVNNSYGTRNYKLWVPNAYEGNRPVPLLMMLHGCTQTPDDFAVGTGMNAIADKERFLVVYPEQPQSANLYKCWNWFDVANQSRGAGEPSLLAEIVTKVTSTYRIDARRIYVAGISAGGAMAVIMSVDYPEIFAAVGVHSGLEFKAATNLNEGLAVLKAGGPDPKQQGRLAYLAMGKAKRTMRVIVFQGLKDGAVAPINADQVITQWATTNDLADNGREDASVNDVADNTTNAIVTGGYAYTKYVYVDRRRKPLMEKWIVPDMKHAWSGGSGVPYTDPKGPNASEEMWRFFRETRPR